MRVRVIAEGERVPVRLKLAQRDLVLEHAFIDPALEQRLRDAETDGASVVARLDLDDLEELGGAVAAVANHTEDAKLQKRLDLIYNRLRHVEETYTDDPSTVQPGAALFSPPRYTPMQGQYLAFIHYYAKINGKSPAEADMQRYFKVSPPTVHRMILALEEHGLIERSPGQARSIRLLVDHSEVPNLE